MQRLRRQPADTNRPPPGLPSHCEGLIIKEENSFPMTTLNPSAPEPRPSGHFTGGVEHVNVPHTENFTVVGNHLAQHRDLSLTAIGLALHIQSLPAGTPIGIKALAKKFPEGEIRIAAALRELEEHGYLRRTKERLRSGRVMTRTQNRRSRGPTTRRRPACSSASASTSRACCSRPGTYAASPRRYRYGWNEASPPRRWNAS
ncbi:hypothetical protein GCM10023220_44080 [Streptomyces ziwulingensis]|uniref:Helix-turn-helix domain-containing protein n=1 Tax=Streptomyces ziwulingensis TaxID=1045501 RepID=A0ABP9CED0_9ACTN